MFCVLLFCFALPLLSHLPLFLQIAAFLIDLMNAYSQFVHGVAPQKLVLQKVSRESPTLFVLSPLFLQSLSTLEELYARLGDARLM